MNPMADPIIQAGNGMSPTYRLDDLLMRRRLAALAGQWRTYQRYSKKLKLFCAAFGVDPSVAEELPGVPKNGFLDDEKTGRDPDKHQSLASCEHGGYDIKSARATTARNMAAVAAILNDAGFKVSRAHDGHLTEWNFRRGDTRVELSMVGDLFWCAGASINGERLALFDFQTKSRDKVARGIPPALASADWDGKITASDAQNYLVSWSKLLRICRGM